MSCFRFSGSEDFAGLKPLHSKILDAYALLGVLTYNAGEWIIFSEQRNAWLIDWASERVSDWLIDWLIDYDLCSSRLYSCHAVVFLLSGNHRILYLVVVNSCVSVGKLLFGDVETEILRITGVAVISLRNTVGDEDRLIEFVKLLSSGIFHFAVATNPTTVPTVDITLCAQRNSLNAPTDNRFFW